MGRLSSSARDPTPSEPFHTFAPPRVATARSADGSEPAWLEPMGLTVTEAAKALGVSRKTLSTILNGRAGISPEMVVRLSIAFATTAESWMNQQVQWDLRQAERKRKKLRVKPLAA